MRMPVSYNKFNKNLSLRLLHVAIRIEISDLLKQLSNLTVAVFDYQSCILNGCSTRQETALNLEVRTIRHDLESCAGDTWQRSLIAGESACRPTELTTEAATIADSDFGTGEGTSVGDIDTEITQRATGCIEQHCLHDELSQKV